MKVTCEHCGLPFAVARSTPGRVLYCCSGCALAARVPVDASGQFPVNAALVTALGLGFGLFNQLLFWLLAVLVARRSDGLENAARLAWGSFTIGAAVWAALVLCQARVGARRGADWALAAASGAGLVWAWSVAAPGLAFATITLFALWALRGLRRRKG
jgi:hypothetical protein